MSDGFVTLICGYKKVTVRILRDSGTLQSFVRAAILPFSVNSDTGSCVPVRGVGLHTIFVPVHKMFLSCCLVNGDIEVAVCPALPVEAVDMLLGNDLAGTRVWADDVRPDNVQIPVSIQTSDTCASLSEPLEVSDPEQAGSGVCAPEPPRVAEPKQAVSSVCAITRAMTAALTDTSDGVPEKSCELKKFALSVPNDLCVSRAELVKEQREDASV